MIIQFVLGFVAALGVSGAVFYFVQNRSEEDEDRKEVGQEKRQKELEAEAVQEEEAAAALKEAQREAKKILTEAREAAREIKASVLSREERLDKKEGKLEEREVGLREKRERLERVEEKLEKKKKQLDEELEKRASLTKKEAEEKLLKSWEDSLTAKKARMVKEAVEKAELEAEDKAREVLVSAMESAATDYVTETTVSHVDLPTDSMKGRIIGKEGRNINAFEKVTGVDLEVDETPKEVRISSFDPIRRLVAKRSLEKLIADGRIQPSRIEEIVLQVEKDLEKDLRKFGKELAYKAGVADLPAGLLSLLGKLKFRTSYGQNQAEHTLEVVNLAKALAREVGAREDLAAKAALLHDIGKVRTVEEGKGSHVELGKKVLKKFGVGEELIHTAMAHHRDEQFRNIEAALVYVADAISGARPGARLDDYDSYVERIDQLEEIAGGFSGVSEAYAISAGREVRVLVSPDEISDDEAAVLAHDIAAKIEEEATYPGTVKVNVIRETRASDVAK